jgi:DNA mismatch endonuclease, patch repair protein
VTAGTGRWAKANRKTDTRPEKVLRLELHRLGLRYRKYFAIQLPTTKVRPDIVFSGLKVAVFVDGCFWHGCPEHGGRPVANAEYWTAKRLRNLARDEKVNSELRRAGWLSVRIWEHEALESAVRLVSDALSQRREGMRRSSAAYEPAKSRTE